MLIGMAMRPNALKISQRNRRPGFVDQGHGPLMAKVAPLFVTGAAERDCAALTAALCDRTSTSQSLRTAGMGKALRIITELGQLARTVQKPHPTENRAKKVANRPLLSPRMVFENGELWGFHLKKNAQISNETR